MSITSDVRFVQKLVKEVYVVVSFADGNEMLFGNVIEIYAVERTELKKSFKAS